MEIASSVGLHKKDLRCRARVEVFRVTCGSERVRDGRASDAIPDVGYERDGDVAHDASFPVAFAARDGGERGLLYCTCTCTCRPYEKGVVSHIASYGHFSYDFFGRHAVSYFSEFAGFRRYSKVLIDRVMG